MPLSRLDPAAVKKVSGPSWVPLKQTFLDLSEALLGVADDTAAHLTTIYVKYQVSTATDDPVFAVAWIKTSRAIVVGLSFPETSVPAGLQPPFAGMIYPGVTGYLLLRHGDPIPTEFATWARTAYRTALAKKKQDA